MVRHPQVHLREVYRATRDAVEKYTGKPFNEYVLSGKNTFPQTFCEYNTIGAVVHESFAHLYTMVDYDPAKDRRECGVPTGQAFQYLYRKGRDGFCEFWGHGGIGKYQRDAELFLRGKIPEFYLK